MAQDRRCASATDRSSGSSRSFDHEALLTLARRAHAAAADADTGQLAERLGTFVHALSGHLGRELAQFERLAPADARLLRRGQARVAAVARTLLSDAEAGCAGPPDRCLARAEELLACLALQTRDERRALHGPAGRVGREAGWS